MENPFTRDLKNPETGKIDAKEVWARVRSAFAVLLSLAVLLGGGYVAYSQAKDAWTAYRTVEDFIDPNGVADVVVVIPPGTTLTHISDILVQAGVVKTAKAFDRAAAANPLSKKIQAGQYRLRTQIPAKAALAMLLDPRNMIRNRFQIPEGLRVSAVLPILSKATGISVKDFQTALNNHAALGLPAWIGKSNEGFLFPDTYEIPTNPTATSVLKMIVNNFNNVITDLNIQSRAKELGMTPYQVLTMGSLVQREAGRDEDMAKVARVFYNRLAQKLPLQSDATVAYANNITGRVTTTAAERAIDSPYNTYLAKNAGKLPPGPITSPAQKPLDAALNPASGKWLFFVVVNLDTGETDFNETFAEHQASVAKFQQFCQTSDKC